jgi:MFS family permease
MNASSARKPLISLNEALGHLLGALSDHAPVLETVSTFDADGRVLAQDVVSALQVPPQDNSSMDGYALRVAECVPGAVLPVSQRIAAGASGAPLAAGTVGALISGLWVASRGKVEGTTRLAVLAVAAQAVATLAFIATGYFPLGLLAGAFMGAAGSVNGISIQTLVQNAADPGMRGRVLAMWGMITRACPAIGALMLGAAGEAFGLRLPTLVFALLTLVAFVWGWRMLPHMARVLESRAAMRMGETHHITFGAQAPVAQRRTFRLSAEDVAFIDAEVAAGRHDSGGEVVRAGLAALRAQQAAPQPRAEGGGTQPRAAE